MAIFTDDFESGIGDWTPTIIAGSVGWQLGTPSVTGPPAPHSGSNCWGTNLSGDYSSSCNYTLTSPAISLVGVAQPQLTFWLWYVTEEGWDGGTLQITINGGSSWSQILNAQIDPDFDAVLDDGAYGGLWGWTGNKSALGWRQFTVDLSSYIGETIQLKFCLGADSGGNAAGLYLDDFIVVDLASEGELSGIINTQTTLSAVLLDQGQIEASTSSSSEIVASLVAKGKLTGVINSSSQTSCGFFIGEYIDPTFEGTSDGSITNPWKAFPLFTEGHTYLLKAGTTLTLDSTLLVNANGVTITSYGEGEKPIIYNPASTRRTIFVTGNNVTFLGICSQMPQAPDYNTGEWNIATYNVEDKNTNTVINNCDIIGGSPGVHAYKSTSLRVLNSTITHACYDSYYGEYVDYVEFDNCTIENMDWDPLDLSQDLIHIKHAHQIVINNCVLDHNFPGKYCIIAHQDDPGFDDTTLTVTNTTFIGSADNEALVKASVPYNSFTNCTFLNSQRTMQDVWANLTISNCLVRSTSPSMIQGIPWCDNPIIENSTFIGLTNPYLGTAETTNCIFWNCVGGGDYWENSLIDPNFDANFDATGELTGVGYVSTGTPLEELSGGVNTQTSIVSVLQGLGKLSSSISSETSVAGFMYSENTLYGTVEGISSVGGELGGVGDLQCSILPYSQLVGVLIAKSLTGTQSKQKIVNVNVNVLMV